MKRKRLSRFLLFSLLALLVGVPSWLAYKDIHQSQLDAALIAAIQKQDTNKAIALLNEGANANARDVPRDPRPFWRRMWAHLRRKPDQAPPAASALLLAVEGPPGTGINPENVPLVKVLVDRGANVNAREEHGRTALMAAVTENHIATVRLLLDSGASINLKDDGGEMGGVIAFGKVYPVHYSGRTALQYAAETEDVSIMPLLLNRGADVNVRDGDGQTLLISAAAWNRIELARLLLAYHANLAVRDNGGRTALMMAQINGYEEIIALLKKAGAQK